MPNWPNGLIYYNETDIATREALIAMIPLRLKQEFKKVNRAIDFVRVETPCLVPVDMVRNHLEHSFPVWFCKPNELGDPEYVYEESNDYLFLRPESTRSTYEMFDVLFTQEKQLKKWLPFCIWQVNMSFRVEQDKTFSNLRFKQFYQMEFQLAYSPDTKADYHAVAVEAMVDMLMSVVPDSMPVETMPQEGEDLPFYSKKTTDLNVVTQADVMEVAAVSSRTDFKLPIIEISVGLDRLTYLCAPHTVEDSVPG